MNDILDDLKRYKADAMRSQDAGRQIVYTRAVDEIERLRDLARRAADMIDDAYSGYIPGSGADEGWDKGKESLLAELRAAESASLTTGNRE